MRLFSRRPRDWADLIPLVPRPEWERYHLFEARGEEPHGLSDHDLAERCDVDHSEPRLGVRFAPEEMCEIQWSCTAAYYAWSDEEALVKRRASGSAGAVAVPSPTA
jgi:hypothetical protein